MSAWPALRPQPVALLCLSLAAWLVWAAPGSSSSEASHAGLPPVLGLWSGEPLAVPPRTLKLLGTDQVALMAYRMGQEPPVWLARVDGIGNRAAFHPPEICYVGSHFAVLERGVQTVMVHGQPHRVMRLLVGQGQERFEVWYWFTAGGRVTPSYYQQQAWLLLDTVRGKRMSGSLVRISTSVDTVEAAHRRLLAFVTQYVTLSDVKIHHDT